MTMKPENKPRTVATTVLNIAPMGTPINPYNFGYRYLNASRQDTDSAEVTAQITERMTYMRWLEKRCPPLESNEPIVCLALVRAALDAKARAFLIAALTAQGELVQAAAVKAPPKPAIKPDEVIAAPVAPPTVADLERAIARIQALEAQAAARVVVEPPPELEPAAPPSKPGKRAPATA